MTEHSGNPGASPCASSALRSRRVLFVTPQSAEEVGGREQLSALHERVLIGSIGDNLRVWRLGPKSGWINSLQGWLDGASAATARDLVQAIDAHRIDTVWLDGSNLGRLAQAVKKQRPQTAVITFFHNVEARFFLGALRHKKTLHGMGVLSAHYLAERQAAHHSDCIIALSPRDSEQLKRLYGRSADAIVPMAVQDRLATGHLSIPPQSSNFMLFVGGGFYANCEGILWFGQNVAPYVPLRTVVAGRGLDAVQADLERCANVDFLGSVADLVPLYGQSRIVIAPIFDGSGMKTKVAEALMFGKRILGTPEAFSGYDDILPQAGWSCKSRDCFIDSIGHISRSHIDQFDGDLRKIYTERYSEFSLTRSIQSVLASNQPRA